MTNLDETTDQSGPLAGIEVIEVCSAVAGPFTGKVLGDNGAHVTKVEPLWGANFRNRPLHYDTHGTDGFTYRFLMYNTGKESIAIDLKTSRGKEIMWELIERADVLVENLSSGTFERLGFSWEEMHNRNDELIYCSITGYGDEGPYSDLPAYDATIQGVSGWVDLIGESEYPEKTALLAIDHSTALYAVNGILMALLERAGSGEGQRVDIAMIEAAISFLGHQMAEYSAVQEDDSITPYYWKQEPGGVYKVDDGYISLNIMVERWESFCEAIEREEFTEADHRFSTKRGRIKHRQELREAIEEALAGKTKEEWLDRFEEVDPRMAYAPANRIPELPNDPHVIDRDILVERSHSVMGDYTVPSPALRFSRSDTEFEEAPALAEHTDLILGALGYSNADIAELRSNDVVK